ncbi:MAG: hypothetical protein ABIA75_04100 [Candidatus Neomarinimicrobiota bacterium]
MSSWRFYIIAAVAPCLLTAQQLPMVKLFQYRITDYELHFTGDFQSKLRRIEDASYNGRSRRQALREVLEIGGDGSIYHPNLMVYSLALDAGLNQNLFSWAGPQQSQSTDRGFFRNVTFQSVLFSKKPLSMSLGYLRKYRQLNNDFFQDSEDLTRRANLNATWRNRRLPLSFGYTTDQREEYFGSRQVLVDEERYSLSGAWGGLESFRGNVRANHSQIHRREIGLYDIQIENTTVQSGFSLPLGANRRNSYQASLYGNNIVGTDTVTSITWNNRIQQELGRNLRSTAQYNYQYYLNSGTVAQTHRLNSNLQHQLYLSLTSTAGINWEFYQEDAYRKRDLEYRLGWEYTKKLPAGRLSANLEYKPHWTEINSDQGVTRRGEITHNFSESVSLLLPVSGVVPGTVEISDLTGLINYLNEFDYNIYEVGTTVEIQRTPVSAIPDSVDILVRFVYTGERTETTAYDNLSYGVTYQYQSFWGLIAGYKGNSINYSGVSPVSFYSYDERRDHNWFLKLDYNPLMLELTRESSDSRITPYTNTTLSLNGILGSYLSQYLMAQVQVGVQELPLRDDSQEFNRIVMEYFRRLSRNLKAQVSWGQREIRGSMNDLREQKWQGTVRYEVRKLTANLQYEYSERKFFREKEQDSRWSLSIDIRP